MAVCADNKINVIERLFFLLFGNCRKHCGKWQKFWFPAFYPFLIMFEKSSFIVRDCVVKDYLSIFSFALVFSVFCCYRLLSKHFLPSFGIFCL